jgi:hypothetical protein
MPILPSITAAALALAATSAPVTADCKLGTIALDGVFEGAISRDVSCHDYRDGARWEEKSFTLRDTTDVWISFSADDEAQLLLIGRTGGTLTSVTSPPRTSGRFEPQYIEMSLLPGTYRLQVQTRTLGLRYSARLHPKLPNGHVGGCAKAIAPDLTDKEQFSAPAGIAQVGVAAACFDPDGRPGVIRRFHLDRETDVSIAVRPQSGTAVSALHLAGPGADTEQGWSIVAERPGETARFALSLSPGTYYVMFAAGARDTRVDVTMQRTPSVATGPMPSQRHPGCQQPSQLASITVGQTLMERLTMQGSCVSGPYEDGKPRLSEFRRITVAERRAITVEAEAATFAPRLWILDLKSAPLAADPNADGDGVARATATLEPGEYAVAVSHVGWTEIGSFTLRVTAAP